MNSEELAKMLIDQSPENWPSRLQALRLDAAIPQSIAEHLEDSIAQASLADSSQPSRSSGGSVMKKLVSYGLAAGLLIAAGIGVFFLRSPGAPERPAGVIQIVFGKAELSLAKLDAQGQAVSYEEQVLEQKTLPQGGQPFSQGSKLKTSSGAAVELVFAGGIRSRIGENSQITMLHGRLIEGKADESEFSLELAGKFHYKSPALKGQSRFSVTAPTAIASVRGTEFLLEGQPALTTLTVFEGSVELEARAQPKKIRVEAGQRAVVDAYGNIIVATLFPLDQFQRTQFNRSSETFQKYGTGPLNADLELDSEDAIRKHYGKLFTVKLIDGREYTGFPSIHGSVLQIHTTYGVIEMHQSAVASLNELQ